MNIFGKDQRSGLPFPPKIDRKEKRVVSFTHEQNIICCQIKLDDVAYEQTIICMQLFACHVVGCRPMKRKKNLHRVTMVVVFLLLLRKCYRDMFVACVYNDNVLQVLRATRLTSVTQSVYLGFLSNGVQPASMLSYLGEWNESRENTRASSEAARGPSLARSRAARFACPNRRACSQAERGWTVQIYIRD